MGFNTAKYLMSRTRSLGLNVVYRNNSVEFYLRLLKEMYVFCGMHVNLKYFF